MPRNRETTVSVTDEAVARLARRCVGIIEPLLQRPEEAGEAFREFYLAIRQEFSTSPKEAAKP